MTFISTEESQPQPGMSIVNLPELLRQPQYEGLNITTAMLQSMITPPEYPNNKVVGLPIVETIDLPNYRLDITNRITTAKGHIGQILLSSVYGDAEIDAVRQASACALEWVNQLQANGEIPFLFSLVLKDCKLPKFDLLKNAMELNGMLQAVKRAGGWTTDIGEGSSIKNFFTMVVDKFSGTVTHKAKDTQTGFQLIADNG